MESYRRTEIDDGRLIYAVKHMKSIWDPVDESCMDKYDRDDCWTLVFRYLYPDWYSYTSILQLQIARDVKQRWRTVRDRFKKFHAEYSKSGSSPPEHKCPFYKEMLFMETSRTLRSTEGNVLPPEPEDSDTEDSAGTTSESESEAGTSTSADAESSTSASTSRAAYPVAVTEPAPPKKKLKKSNKYTEATRLVKETLELIKKSTAKDHFDFFGLTIASKTRLLPPDRQSPFMAAVHSMLTAFEDPAPIGSLEDVLGGVFSALRPKSQPPAHEPEQQYPRPASTLSFYS